MTMPNGKPVKSSFSPGRKWGLGLNMVLGILAALALLVMANYLGGRHFRRLHLSTRTRVELSTRTLSLLRSLTNQIQVTLYYDKDEPLYSDITDLLKEYRAAAPNLSVATVDYYRDPGAAEQVKLKYNLGAATNKNLVIFDCGGNSRVVDGNLLAQFSLEPVPNQTEREFRRRPVAFNGEMRFSSAILAVTSPKALKACFLQGHGEQSPGDTADEGLAKFAAVLQQNHIQCESISLLTNAVPADCNLLVIAGPRDAIPPLELERVEKYLDEGGHLFVLFSAYSAGHPCGLEKTLTRWGVGVSPQIVKDPDYTTVGTDVIVGTFSKHPVVNPLLGSRLQLILPRAIRKLDLSAQAADAPSVEEIAFSGPRSFLEGAETSAPRQALALLAAVDKGTVKGVVSERGATRILVAGDALFLGNRQIESGANRDFAGYAANWLLDRPALLQGLGPRPVMEYRLTLTRPQMQAVQWLLLGALPGGILLSGVLIWFRRSK
jgi:hypothetical protein